MSAPHIMRTISLSRTARAAITEGDTIAASVALESALTEAAHWPGAARIMADELIDTADSMMSDGRDAAARTLLDVLEESGHRILATLEDEA